MSGDEKRFTVTRGLRFGFDVCDGDEGDKTVLTLVNLSEAHAVAGELNRLAARSGSPEGWPEGAELVTTAQILDEPGVWQVWNQPVIGDGSWTSIDEMTPGGLGVLGNCFPARRKPKPVTRDVLAWDLEPGMRLADGRTVQFTTRMLDSGKRLVEVACVGDRDHSVLACDQTAAVLVEEPNG